MNALLLRIEKLVNRALNYDEESLSSLADLSGKLIAIELVNTKTKVFLSFSDAGLHIKQSDFLEADVTIKGSPSTLLAYVLAEKAQVTGMAGNIEIIGDVGLAQRFQAIMKGLDIDWEEPLSHWFGDTAAHKLGNLIRAGVNFSRQAKKTLLDDVSEYLRYEKEYLLDDSEINTFIADVDRLRHDAERIKLRLHRLEQGLKAEGDTC